MSKPSKKENSIEDKISALPDRKSKPTVWTLEEDAAILKYAELKGLRAIARALGKGTNVVNARYHYLTGKIK